MPRRDPKTGKFVSGSSLSSWHDVDAVSAGLTTTVPAADLAGGTSSANVTGETAELIDFGDPLRDDEIFECHVMHLTATLSMPTTATAESAVMMDFNVMTDLGGAGPGIKAVHYGAGTQRTQGIADVNADQLDDDSILYNGRMTATNSLADSVNGLAAGGDDDRLRETVRFVPDLGVGPRFDEDDELAVPHNIDIDNVSNHAVVATFDVHLVGSVVEP